MKIFIDSYNNVMQHEEGGIPMRITKFMVYFKLLALEAKLFNKWEDKLEDCDILHIFKANLDSFAEIIYAKNLGKKVVISSVIPQEHKLKIKIGLSTNRLIPIQNTYSLLKKQLLLADSIIAQTKKEAKFIANAYGIETDKICVIPNGVNADILNSYNEKATKDIVLCVGRFDRNKNQLSLIKALEGTEYECHFVGGKAIEEPEYYKLCLKLAKKNPHIHFHGWLDNSSHELLSLYRRAKVVALVSHKEIFGNSIIEGGACGANLLVTNALPTEEWGFDNACIKVNASNIGELKQGLAKAFSLPLNSATHDIIKKQFSWENIAKKHIELYNFLLKK